MKNGGHNFEARTSKGCVASTPEDKDILVSKIIISYNSEKQFYDGCVVDSSPTWHMTPRWALNVFGVSIVKIKVYDGIVCTIQRIQHVKNLIKNLLSTDNLLPELKEVISLFCEHCG